MSEVKPVINSKSLVKTISSESLFGEAQMIEIRHGTDTYQLRVTKTGKLILTK
ncbi:MAG: Hemin uptake protein hemP [Pseudomonadota bacterium]|jgi:hemin uptake protein HemP